MIMRQPSVDLEIEGGDDPAGIDHHLHCSAAANRDPRIRGPGKVRHLPKGQQSERAYRASADHLAFIDGRHFCVGAMLARTQIEIGMNSSARPDGRHALPDGFVPVEQGVFTRAPNRLEVSFAPV